MTNRSTGILLSLGLLGVAAVLGLGAFIAAARPSVPRGVAPDHVLGPTRERTVINFVLVLRQREHALDRYLHELDDPGSSSFGHYLTARQIGERFGISESALARMRQRLEAAGLHVIASYPQRTEIGVRSTAREASAFFGVRFWDYRDRLGRVYHAPARQPAVPARLARWVVGVAGLSSERRMVPLAVPNRTCGLPEVSILRLPCSGLAPKDAARAYDIVPLHARGLMGEGQTVAIVSFGWFDRSDVKLFDETFKIRGPRVEQIKVGKGKVTKSGPILGEVNLDVDTIRAVAPKAKILNFVGASDVCCFSRIFNRIVADGRARVISVSYGACDIATDPYIAFRRKADLTAMKAARAAGITIFIASGDAGAYTCQRVDLGDHRVTATWPGDSPYAVSVGGTLLSVRRDGSYLEEAGWEYPMTNLGTGGGVSPVDLRPAWQTAPGVPSGSKRVFPDISAAADPASGFLIASEGTIQPSGGTSASAPFWAGSFALVRQFAQRSEAGKVGFLAPILYALARSRQPYPPFHDVRRGGNRYYDAGPGWDYPTGLGSPDVYNLARDVVRYLKSR